MDRSANRAGDHRDAEESDEELQPGFRAGQEHQGREDGEHQEFAGPSETHPENEEPPAIGWAQPGGYPAFEFEHSLQH